MTCGGRSSATATHVNNATLQHNMCIAATKNNHKQVINKIKHNFSPGQDQLTYTAAGTGPPTQYKRWAGRVAPNAGKQAHISLHLSGYVNRKPAGAICHHLWGRGGPARAEGWAGLVVMQAPPLHTDISTDIAGQQHFDIELNYCELIGRANATRSLRHTSHSCLFIFPVLSSSPTIVWRFAIHHLTVGLSLRTTTLH